MTARKTTLVGFVVALAIYIVRILPWAMAQLWLDEVITLYHYCGAFHPNATLGAIFRSYTMANNHMLSSVVYWLWLRVVPLTAPEILLRLPSLLFGALTLAVIVFWWRKWLGARIAVLGAIVFAASPVFPAFAYQIRGYSLSMLLAAIGVALAATLLEQLQNKTATWRTQLALFLTSLAQPLIMPSAAVFPAAIASWIALERYPGCNIFGKNSQRAIVAGVPTMLGALLGVAYYLTLGEQFRIARLDAAEISADWWTTSSSFLHVLLALVVHLGVLMLPLVISRFVRNLWRTPLFNRSNIILISWIGMEFLMYSVVGRQAVPFPRNSLVFFPLVTFSALLSLCALPHRFRCSKVLLGAAVVVIFFGIGITYWQERTCLQMVRAGDIPQDLLKQQYRGDDSTRTIVRNLHEAGLCETSYLLVSDNDGTVAKWYYNIMGHPSSRTRDRTETLENPIFWQQPDGPAKLFVSARLAPEADQLYRMAQYPLPHKCMMQMKYRDFYGPQ